VRTLNVVIKGVI